ncbi:MAG: hypothetical protein ACR2PA_22795, partial [Hyphomicrobiaceae bacterium]
IEFDQGHAMTSSQLGLICLFLFAAAQGARDAFFGKVFQSTSFLLVAVMAFGLSLIVFAASSLIRRPGEVRRLIERRTSLALLNGTTAAAWLSFFFGLKYLEPAVVATLFNGIGPLVVLIGGRLGWTSARTRLSRAEWSLYLGLAVSLAMLSIVVLTNRSGMTGTDVTTQALALLLVVFGGTMITASYIVTRDFTDAGFGSDTVMGARFLLTLVLAAGLELMVGASHARPPVANLPVLALGTFALIVIPSFLVQFGVSRTTPLAANIFRALGPVFVFAVQQFDCRLQFSIATLACIVAFCIFTVAASATRGWKEARAAIA